MVKIFSEEWRGEKSVAREKKKKRKRNGFTGIHDKAIKIRCYDMVH